MSKIPKTTGLEWLTHSMNNFNGTIYCDRTSGEAFFESYLVYKKYKKKDDAVRLANEHYGSILPLCEHLSTLVYDEPELATEKQLAYINHLNDQLGRKQKDYSTLKKDIADKRIKRMLRKLGFL